MIFLLPFPTAAQLVMMFSVLFTALVQALLLRRRLPLYTWPCAACMLGGACMVIVPNLSQVRRGPGWVMSAVCPVRHWEAPAWPLCPTCLRQGRA